MCADGVAATAVQNDNVDVHMADGSVIISNEDSILW